MSDGNRSRKSHWPRSPLCKRHSQLYHQAVHLTGTLQNPLNSPNCSPTCLMHHWLYFACLPVGHYST
uniref:Uncharacterized protein n=1 Tax=Arundo donax TaxID=35708 RepID=A0A0A9EIW6_ARUDO